MPLCPAFAAWSTTRIVSFVLGCKGLENFWGIRAMFSVQRDNCLLQRKYFHRSKNKICNGLFHLKRKLVWYFGKKLVEFLDRIAIRNAVTDPNMGRWGVSQMKAIATCEQECFRV
jgi:hypothetical protein